MKRILTVIILLTVAVLMGASWAIAQDKPAASEQDQQAMMKKYMEMVAPGPEHAAMAKDVGKWNGVMKMWMAPGATPQEMNTTKTVAMDMDGRYSVEDETGMMNGMPYRGHNTIGFDKFRGEYVFSYYDNMSTGIWTATGQADKDGKTITFNAKMDDPMTNRKDVPTRVIVKTIDDDHSTMEMWTQSPDGKEYKCMENTYTRAK